MVCELERMSERMSSRNFSRKKSLHRTVSRPHFLFEHGQIFTVDIRMVAFSFHAARTCTGTAQGERFGQQ